MIFVMSIVDRHGYVVGCSVNKTQQGALDWLDEWKANELGIDDDPDEYMPTLSVVEGVGA